MDELRTNMIFAYFPKDIAEHLSEKYHLHILDKSKGLIRLVTSFDTNKEDIDKLIDSINLSI